MEQRCGSRCRQTHGDNRNAGWLMRIPIMGDVMIPLRYSEISGMTQACFLSTAHVGGLSLVSLLEGILKYDIRI